LSHKERQNLLYLICGVNGSGKTQFVRKFIDASPKRVLIINPTYEKKWDIYPKIDNKKPEELRTFKGIRQLQPDYVFGSMRKPFIKILQLMWENYENGVVVIDDCREIINATLVEEVGSIMRGYRQHNIDIFAIFHSINQIPPKFWEHCNGYIVIFKTQDSLEKIKDKIPSHKREEVLATWAQVMKESETNKHVNRIVQL